MVQQTTSSRITGHATVNPWTSQLPDCHPAPAVQSAEQRQDLTALRVSGLPGQRDPRHGGREQATEKEGEKGHLGAGADVNALAKSAWREAYLEVIKDRRACADKVRDHNSQKKTTAVTWPPFEG